MHQESVMSIYLRMREKMLALGNSLLKNADDVNDAMQDTFCRVWSSRDRISECDNANGFVLMTMRNVCIDNIRGRKYTVEMPDELMPADEAADDRQENSGDEIYAVVSEIINHELSEIQRRIMRMRDVEGYSYAEIAKIMRMEGKP